MGRTPPRRTRSGRRLLGVALVVVAAGGGPVQARDGALRVLAAASLTEVAAELAQRFAETPGGTRVETVVGASSVLARQIRDGAPADVFLSASPAWMDFLADAEALAGASVAFARGRLVCVAPPGSPLARRGVPDARALFEVLGPQGRVAVADAGVPAGEYARGALRSRGLLADARGRLVGHKDVRAVLHAVERGALDAGFVYASDAAVARVAVLFALDPATHPPVVYRGAVLRDARAPGAARRFLAFLQTDAARAVLVRAGFDAP